MPQFSANLSMLFTELPFLERFDAAAATGFTAVEFMFPYEYKASELLAALERNKLSLVLHNLPAGDWSAGDRGIACQPSRIAEFRNGVSLACEYAPALGTPRVNCLAGIPSPSTSAESAHSTLVDNLRFAAEELSKVDVELVIEPVNTRDIPGFFVNTTTQAIAIMDEVGSDNLKLQFDIYHTQVMEGDLANKLSALLPRIGHIQIADNPGRHEPGTGEINYPFLFRHIDAIGYRGHVGAEYKPAGDTPAGLGWLERAQDLAATA